MFIQYTPDIINTIYSLILMGGSYMLAIYIIDRRIGLNSLLRTLFRKLRYLVIATILLIIVSVKLHSYMLYNNIISIHIENGLSFVLALISLTFIQGIVRFYMDE